MNKKIISIILSLIMTICTVIIPVSAYADNYYISGVDISEHNDNVNLSALKAQGYSFVMIRLGYFNHLDNKFYENVQNAVNAGMNFGVYLYSYAFNSAEAQTEAQFTINTLSNLSQEAKALMTYPVAYDIEDSSISSKLDKNAITNNAFLFTSLLSQNGYDTMVYSNTYWFNTFINADLLSQNGIKLWCADYTSSPMTKGNTSIGNTNSFAYMWQYSDSQIDQNVILMTDAQNLTVKLSKSSVTYNGKAQKPSVTVFNQSGQKIPAAYYTVKYSGNTKPGKATVKIDFNGIFFGSKTANFIIKPKKPTQKKLKSKSKKQLNVSWKKDKNVSGYEIKYSTSSKFTRKTTKTVKAGKKSTGVTVKKLKSRKKYYVKLRSYKIINGKKYYSSYSSTKSIKTK